jgi:ceramide glucosyltransferase
MILGIIFALISSLGLAFWLLALVYRWKERRKPPHPIPALLPSVSILKPLKGLDDELELNLRSFFELSYPKFEILFGINDLDDPAIELVRKLISEYPKVSARLIVDTKRVGPNPKVNNLANLYPQSHNEIIVINDSNTRVIPNYLHTLISALYQPGVGLVTSPIRGIGEVGLGAHLENLQINSFVAGSIPILQDLFGIPITIGKSMAVRRETLERVGGFAPLSIYLAEDDQLGKAVQRLEFTVARSLHAVDNVNISWPFMKFVHRQVRWAMMRRYTTLEHYLAEPFANPILMSFFCFLVAPLHFGLAVFLMTSFIKMTIDWSLLKAHRAPTPLYALLLVPFKDVLMLGMWFVPLFQGKVAWRGHQFRIGVETEVELVQSAAS